MAPWPTWGFARAGTSFLGTVEVQVWADQTVGERVSRPRRVVGASSHYDRSRSPWKEAYTAAGTAHPMDLSSPSGLWVHHRQEEKGGIHVKAPSLVDGCLDGHTVGGPAGDGPEDAVVPDERMVRRVENSWWEEEEEGGVDEMPLESSAMVAQEPGQLAEDAFDRVALCPSSLFTRAWWSLKRPQ